MSDNQRQRLLNLRARTEQQISEAQSFIDEAGDADVVVSAVDHLAALCQAQSQIESRLWGKAQRLATR